MTSATGRLIALRYPATCATCGRSLFPGDRAFWDRASRTAECVWCRSESAADPWAGLDPELRGSAGRSAATEYQRRRQAREQRVRSRHRYLGDLILTVSKEPNSTTSWGRGAEGERAVGERLDNLAQSGAVEVLHDRAIPASRANLDHIVVGPAGVFVVDAKKYKGRIERRPSGSLFRPSSGRLLVDRRDQTRLVEGMARQVEAVQWALQRLQADPEPAVIPVLCFVNAEWPILQGTFCIGQVRVVWPRALDRLVRRAGPIGANHRLRLARGLAAHLPPA